MVGSDAEGMSVPHWRAHSTSASRPTGWEDGHPTGVLWLVARSQEEDHLDGSLASVVRCGQLLGVCMCRNQAVPSVIIHSICQRSAEGGAWTIGIYFLVASEI